jgi:hypothetical protein
VTLIPPTILAAAGLSVLACSPVFAAKYGTHPTGRHGKPIVATAGGQLRVPSQRVDNPDPYIGLWVQGYPRSGS